MEFTWSDPTQWIINKLWQHTFDKMETSPMEHSVLLTDIPNNLKANRERIGEIMFETFRCPEMYIAIQAILSLHAYGLVTGVAVDCGADLTQIVPTIDGYSIPDATTCLPLGGQDLTLHLLKLLAENGITFKAKHCIQDVRRIKEKLCYVAEDFNEEIAMAKKSCVRRTYTLPDNHTITVGKEQFCCPEALFQPLVLGKNFDGIHKICCDNITKAAQPDEITKDLYRNIVLSGGSSMISGLPKRFAQEVQMLAPSHVTPNVLVVPSRQHNVWIGGSIVASLPAFQEMWLTRQDYEENGPSFIHKKCI